ncbi:MAG TPA: type IV pilus modification protein PilV [Steroidobacteraceae bacterium]|jgi:type IV pilus assembly protein PilV
MNRRTDRGFTLVEVLVSLVVLSVGLLGMAKMVMVSSHSNDSAYLRSQATALAYQALDRMRANLPLSTTNGYATALGAMPATPAGWPNAGCMVGCANAALAAWDVYAWKQALLALPSGTGSITTSGTFPMTATVTVRWDDSVAQSVFQGAGAQMAVTLETVLQ